jgi:hypothetical protein
MSIPLFREMGVVRRLVHAALVPYFGTHRPAHSEILPTSCFYAVLFTYFGFGIPFGAAHAPTWVCVLGGAVALSATVAAELFDAHSLRVLNAGEVAFRTPIPLFSWSVPFSSIQRCEVVLTKPQPRLRVFTTEGSVYALPLTRELWASMTGE